MAIMNMVSSNINQWTMLAAMIPIVFSLSLGRFGVVEFDRMHSIELLLTIAQSLLGGLLLLDLRFSIFDASAIFVLWVVQFLDAHLREEVTIVYGVWIAVILIKVAITALNTKKYPRAIELLIASRMGRGPRDQQ